MKIYNVKQRGICFLAIILISISMIAEVKVFSSPGDLSAIPHIKGATNYSVKVNGQSSFVYKSDNYWTASDNYARKYSDSVAFTNFEFKNEPVNVEINCNFAVNSVRIRPNIDSLDLSDYSVTGNTIRFTIDKSKYLSVEVNNKKYPLFIFADTIETVKPTDYDVKFAAGVHNLGSKYELTAGQRVYIEGGAVVQATFLASGDNIKIFGRGILTSGHVAWKTWLTDKKLSPLSNSNIGNHKNYSISGITMANTPGWCINGFSQGQNFWNLKIIAWTGNSDAPHLCGNGKFEHCFVFNNDDALITNSGNNNIFRDNVVWKGPWGRVMISIQSSQDNNLWEDVDVIGNEAATSNLNGKNIGIFELDNGVSKTNFTFRNIRIEEPTTAGLIHFDATNRTAGATVPNTISNITIENVTAKTLHSYNTPNQGEGYISTKVGSGLAGSISNVKFKCITFGNTMVSSLAEAHIVANGTTPIFDNSACY
ncbi:MAG: hypothetical protein ACOYOT_14040, partial [Bacteroidales bacterium]